MTGVGNGERAGGREFSTEAGCKTTQLHTGHSAVKVSEKRGWGLVIVLLSRAKQYGWVQVQVKNLVHFQGWGEGHKERDQSPGTREGQDTYEKPDEAPGLAQFPFRHSPFGVQSWITVVAGCED